MRVSRRILVVWVTAALLSSATVAQAASGRGSTKITWADKRVEVTVVPGVMKTRPVQFRSTGPQPANPVIKLVGPLADVANADLFEGRVLDDGTFEVTLEIAAERPGRFPGTVHIVDGNKRLGTALPVMVVAAQATGIPVGPAPPAPDRIVFTESGTAVVVDELIVGVVPNTTDPDAVAVAAAAAGAGTIIGSLRELGMYQIRYPVGSYDELLSLVPTIEGVAGVEFVSVNTVELDPDVHPNDSLWDDWSSTSGGNNWGLEWIDAPGAWDLQTGSPSVRVGVIDMDNDDDHTDLDDNVVNTARGPVPPRAPGHGTHVAGTACAEGNNGKGITGVAWDCELRFYVAGDAFSTADKMRSAVDDGNRVINMSLQYIKNGTEVTITDGIRQEVDDTNDTFGRAVLYGLSTGRDPLWVMAAGNEFGRDVRWTAPGGLVARFPQSVMAVAAIGRDGHLTNFSNQGDLVSVAAPGFEILSTLPRTGCWPFALFCDDNYGFYSGTSMAAPHVTGLAALVFSDDPSRTAADVKSCIIAGAQREGTEVPGQSFRTINAPAAIRCDGVIDLPPVVDFVLSFDLTGSMGGVLGQAKAQMETAIADIAAAAPGSDIRYSVISYEDYPGYFDSRPCGSSYTASYGSSSDEPFRIDAGSSDETSSTIDAIRSLSLGSGDDGPESYGRALWEIAQPDTRANLGLRPDALVIAINFGDNVPHDTNLNEGLDISGVYDTGRDPGRDGVVCTDDDIDFQDDALGNLKDAGIRLLHVDSGSLERYWRPWTAETGGAYARLSGRDLSEVILELLALI